MNIGSRLKQLLEERNKTVSWLARESGIPAQTLYAMINRDSNKADMEIMAKLLKALDMDFQEFLGLDKGLAAKEKGRSSELSIPKEAEARIVELAHDCGIADKAEVQQVFNQFLEEGFRRRPSSLEELFDQRAPRTSRSRQEIDDYLL